VKLKLPDNALGLDVQCPHCQHVFRSESQAIREKPPDAEIYPGRAPVLPERPFASGFDADEEESFRPLRPLAGLGRAMAAIIMLIISLFLEGISIALGFLYILQINKLIAAGPFGVDVGPVQTLEDLISLFSIFQLVVFIGTGVVFLTWIYSAYANLETLGSDGLHYSPGWAVGYFFIPFLNLVRPLQVVQEIWRASDPEENRTNSALAGFWWACWILSGILGYISFQMVRHPQNTLELIRSSNILYIVSTLLSIIGGILVIFLIKGIMSRQREKFQRLTARSAP
jgi:hypothetical protein